MEIIKRQDGRRVYENASEEEIIAISSLIRDEDLPLDQADVYSVSCEELVSEESVFKKSKVIRVAIPKKELKSRRLKICEALFSYSEDSPVLQPSWRIRYNRFEARIPGRGTYHVEFDRGSTKVLTRGWHDDVDSLVEGDWL